jgi:hypothetical protein
LHFLKPRSQGLPLVIDRNGCERGIRRNSSLSQRHRPSLLTSEHLLPGAEAEREPAVIGVRLTVTRASVIARAEANLWCVKFGAAGKDAVDCGTVLAREALLQRREPAALIASSDGLIGRAATIPSIPIGHDQGGRPTSPPVPV